MGAVACEDSNHCLAHGGQVGAGRVNSPASLFPPSILTLGPPTSQTQPEARGQGSPGATVHRAGQRMEISSQDPTILQGLFSGRKVECVSHLAHDQCSWGVGVFSQCLDKF